MTKRKGLRYIGCMKKRHIPTAVRADGSWFAKTLCGRVYTRGPVRATETRKAYEKPANLEGACADCVRIYTAEKEQA